MVIKKEDIEKLLKKDYCKLKRLAFNFVKNEQNAEDIVSDVFIKILQDDKFRGDSSVKTYVTKAIIQKSLDFLAKQKRENGIINKDFELDEFSIGRNEDICNFDIYDYFEFLTKVECDLIKLKYLDGLSYLELSKIFNNSVGNLKVAVLRIKKKIIDRFNENERV
jgi:RNA polymerase sigma-70 factor, ECF subfamily